MQKVISETNLSSRSTAMKRSIEFGFDFDTKSKCGEFKSFGMVTEAVNTQVGLTYNLQTFNCYLMTIISNSTLN